MKRELSEIRKIWTKTLNASIISKLKSKKNTLFFSHVDKLYSFVHLMTVWSPRWPPSPIRTGTLSSVLITFLSLDPAQSLGSDRASTALVESMDPLFKIGKIKMSYSTKWYTTQRERNQPLHNKSLLLLAGKLEKENKVISLMVYRQTSETPSKHVSGTHVCNLLQVD